MADGAGELPAKGPGAVNELAPEAAAEVLGEGPALAPSTLLRASASEGPPSPLREGGTRRKAPAVHYSEALAGRIVAGVAAGESVRTVCRGREMPHPSTVYAWARAEPRFGRALSAAHVTARRATIRAQRKAAAEKWARGRDPRGRWSTFTPELGDEICWRLIEGQSLKTIGADPEMPCAGTILRWVKTMPAFEDAYAQAGQMAAEVMFHEARDVAMAATASNVWAQKLKVDTIFRMIARMRPRKYCERVVAEEAIGEMRAEADPDRGGLTVIIKRPEDITPEEREAARLTAQGLL